ncbi:MAG: hypothetical protein WC565_02720 [Parcubacteria group bacterium]
MDEKKKTPVSTIIFIVLVFLLLVTAIGNIICLLCNKVSIDVASAGANAKINATGITITGSPSPDGKLAPGVWSEPKPMTIKNLGLLPVRYKISAEASSESFPGFADAIMVCIRKTNGGTTDASDWPIIYEGKLNNLHIDSAETLGNLNSGAIHCFIWEFKLDDAADNTSQNVEATFTYTFTVMPMNTFSYWG